MLKWEILGIEATDDLKEIKKAYIEKLKDTNPEEKPEEFKALREAYEEAQKEIKEKKNNKNTDEDENSNEKPVQSAWKKKLSDIYFDFQKRIDIKEWEALFSDDFCEEIDTKDQAEQELLVFFMQNNLLPNKIWKYIDKVFQIEEKMDELSEDYPRGFIYYIVHSCINGKDRLPYELFAPGKDTEEIGKYLELFNSFMYSSSEEKDKRTEIVEKLKELSEKHIYTEILELAVSSNAEKEKITRLEEIYHEYEGKNEDAAGFALEPLIYAYWDAKEFKKSEDVIRERIRNGFESCNLRVKLAESLAEQGKYYEASLEASTANYLGVKEMTGLNDAALSELSKKMPEWNKKLIEEYTEKLKNDPDNNELKCELAGCYMDLNDIKQVMKIMKTVTDSEFDRYFYYNLNTYMNVTNEKWQDALENANKLIETVEGMKEDGTEKTARRRRWKSRIYSYRAMVYSKLGEKDKAVADCLYAYEADPDSDIVFSSYIGMLLDNDQLQTAIKEAEEYRKKNPNRVMPYEVLMDLCFEAHYDTKAMEWMDHCVALEGTTINSLIIKVLIYLRNQVYDQSDSLVEYLKENKIRIRGFYEAYRLMRETEEILKSDDELKVLNHFSKCMDLENIVDEKNENTNSRWKVVFYYNMAEVAAKIYNEQKDFKGCAECNPRTYLDKGLELSKNDKDILGYKGFLSYKQGMYSEGIKCFEKLHKNFPEDASAKYYLAACSANIMEKKADVVKKCLEGLANLEEDSFLCYQYGKACTYMGDYEKAFKYYEKELELDENELSAYYRIANLYIATGNTEKALEYVDKGIKAFEVVKNNYKLEYFYELKLDIYKSMGAFDKAVDLLKDYTQYFPVDNKLNTFSNLKPLYDYKKTKEYRELCRYFGKKELYAEILEKEIKGCKTYKQKKYDEYIIDRIEYAYITDNYKKGYLDVLKWRFFYGPEEYSQQVLREYALIYAINNKFKSAEKCMKYSGRTQKTLSYWDSILYHELDASVLSEVYTTIKYCYFAGLINKKNIRKRAEKVFEGYKKLAEEYSQKKKQYLYELAIISALLGKTKEACDYKQKADECYKCLECFECGCPEKAISEMYIELCSGNPEKANEIVVMGRKKWPGDEDFIVVEQYIKKKISEKKDI